MTLMASVATPDHPVVIVYPTPALPPVSERTPAMVMSVLGILAGH